MVCDGITGRDIQNIAQKNKKRGQDNFEITTKMDRWLL